MKVGMVVYSKTGNTLAVAEKLRSRLDKAGHSVTLERLTTVGEVDPMARECRFEAQPDLAGYDALVFCSFVQGFSLNPVMKIYMAGAPQLPGKKVGLLVTQHFKRAWTGGNQAVKALKSACQSRGGMVCGSGIVHWSSPDRDRQITEVVESLGRAFE